MNFLENVQKGVLPFFNFPYIPKELLNEIKGPVILHISDTPIDIYSYIFRIVNILKPKYIIHTGDLADNIKLEYKPNRLDFYIEGATKLINGLEENSDSKIYYSLGNHDDHKTVRKVIKRGSILKDNFLILDNVKLAISHYYMQKAENAEFMLFGHSLEPGHYKENNTHNLNGLLNINIIDLSSKRVFYLAYPPGTNKSRGMEFRSLGL